MPTHCSCGKCRSCKLLRTDELYRSHWARAGLALPLLEKNTPYPATPKQSNAQRLMTKALACIHKGPKTNAEITCDECGARHTLIPILTCAKHGECTERVSVDRKLHSCKTCPDREAPL